MKYILKEYHRNIPDKELIDDLCKVARQLKKDFVSIYEYTYCGKYNVTTLADRFGGWNEALKKAGLKTRKVYRVTHEDLILNLKKVWDSLGRQPRWIEMVKPLSLYRPGVYANHFGTWCDALKAFVECANKGMLKTMTLKKPLSSPPLQNKNMEKFQRKITKGMRYDVLRRDNFICKICGMSPIDDPTIKLHVDHIVPIAKGGQTIVSNLQTLCSDCNLGKAAKFVKQPAPITRNKSRKHKKKKKY